MLRMGAIMMLVESGPMIFLAPSSARIASFSDIQGHASTGLRTFIHQCRWSVSASAPVLPLVPLTCVFRRFAVTVSAHLPEFFDVDQ